MGRRPFIILLLLAAIAGCVRVKGLPYRPIHRTPPPIATVTTSCERTRSLEADRAAWEAVHPTLTGRLVLASSRPPDPALVAGRVHLVGAVRANVAEVPNGGAPLGELLFGAAHPTWEADLGRIAVVEGDRAWLVDWWNLSDGGLRSCPFRVGGGSLVVVFPSRGHESELRYRFWDVLARQMAASADETQRARAAAASLCKPIE